MSLPCRTAERRYACTTGSCRLSSRSAISQRKAYTNKAVVIEHDQNIRFRKKLTERFIPIRQSCQSNDEFTRFVRTQHKHNKPKQTGGFETLAARRVTCATSSAGAAGSSVVRDASSTSNASARLAGSNRALNTCGVVVRYWRCYSAEQK